MAKRKTLVEQILDADIRCRMLLAAATDARLDGNEEKALRIEERAQKALDTYNQLTGRN